MYEITVQRVFAAAHAIRLPDGSLEPIHGHNWQVEVTVCAQTLDAIETVMDFHDLERMVNALIDRVHNRHLNEVPPFAGPDGKLAINTTAERVAWWFATEISGQLRPPVHLVSASVSEAPGCIARYRPDNHGA
jgi:6-pyruvoyltetrahydropterin/6-carboxytetrahydropterin synthase